MKVFVESLEKISPWVLLEYKNISRLVGRDNLTFSNCPEKKLGKLGEVVKESVNRLRPQGFIVLDPSAKKILKTGDFRKFSGIIVGGICGDFPPKERTKEAITYPAERRNIGKLQLSTDNAVLVAKWIKDGRKLEDIKFVDGIEIRLNDIESVRLEFRYPLAFGKPVVTPGLKELLRGKKRF